MVVRAGPERKQNAKELMPLNSPSDSKDINSVNLTGDQP